MKRITNRNYVTMKDILGIDSWYTTTQGFSDLFSGYSITFTDTAYTKELFQKYVLPKCWKMPVTYVDTYNDDLEDQDYLPAIYDWLGELYSWLNETQIRYEYLIKTQTDELEHLMDDVSSEQKTKFNDTPQTTTSDLDSDDYLTNITTSTSTNQVATKISRIEEIKRYLKSIYREWLQDFMESMVVYRFNVEEEIDG